MEVNAKYKKQDHKKESRKEQMQKMGAKSNQEHLITEKEQVKLS